jgi:hypothetical protein
MTPRAERRRRMAKVVTRRMKDVRRETHGARPDIEARELKHASKRAKSQHPWRRPQGSYPKPKPPTYDGWPEVDPAARASDPIDFENPFERDEDEIMAWYDFIDAHEFSLWSPLGRRR